MTCIEHWIDYKTGLRARIQCLNPTDAFKLPIPLSLSTPTEDREYGGHEQSIWRVQDWAIGWSFILGAPSYRLISS